MRLLLLGIFLMNVTFLYGMEEQKPACYSLLYKKQKRKELRTFLCLFERLGKENNAHELPKKVQIKILSYAPSLIYCPSVLNVVLPWVEPKRVPEFIKDVPYYAMKDLYC